MEPVLEVRNLNSYYRRGSSAFGKGRTVQVLKNINVTIGQGEVLGLVGESGSGKSTLAKSILGMTEYEGEIIHHTKRPQMVFQDPMTSLDPTMPIGKQIMEGMLWHYKMPKDAAYKKAVQLLEEVGITDAEKRMKSYPHQLSGGMRQRVVIAIALACDPDLLICDEPTTALDVTIQAKILELIRSIQRERGISVIYITHDLGVVAKVADYVDVMYAGKIVETGTIDEIFYEPRHPYTWGLLSAMPDLDTADDRLYTIPGSPPNLLHEKQGDAFAPRNHYALNIDDEVDPPMFKISDTHYAATWLLDPRAPKVDMPPELAQRIARMRAEAEKIKEAE